MGAINEKYRLGFGMMRLPLLDEEAAEKAAAAEEAAGGKRRPPFGGVDLEKTKELVDRFIEKGFTYFDTAQMYHKFKSEQVVKEVLTSRYPRESYKLATKLSPLYFEKGEALDDVFNACLKRLGVDYLDYYLLHDIGYDNYKTFSDKGCFEWMVGLKQKGLVRHIGVSCHDTAAFVDTLLTDHSELEFVQIQLNYLDWDDAGIDARGSYEVIAKHGKDVIVMEPVRGGSLAKVPEEVETMFKAEDPDLTPASWALRFAADHANVKMILSGMNSMEQVEQNTDLFSSLEPLSDAQLNMLSKAAEIIKSNIAIPCTSCNYCVQGCPMNIAIPNYFALYNMFERDANTEWQAKGYYLRLTYANGKASECIGCGQCESICPQHIGIIETLKKVAERIEE